MEFPKIKYTSKEGWKYVFDKGLFLPYSPSNYKKLIEIADIRKGDLVLDVGCGDYAWTEANGYRVIGLDFSSKQLERIKSKNGFLEPMKGDAESLPFRDESFDAVISYNLLFYLPNPTKAVEEMARVVKPEMRVAGFSHSGTIVIMKEVLKDLGFSVESIYENNTEFVYGIK